MNWISVKKRFPNEDEGLEFIVCINSLYVGVAFYEQVGLIQEFHRLDYDEFRHEDVTHWMPLPEPPK